MLADRVYVQGISMPDRFQQAANIDSTGFRSSDAQGSHMRLFVLQSGFRHFMRPACTAFPPSHEGSDLSELKPTAH